MAMGRAVYECGLGPPPGTYPAPITAGCSEDQSAPVNTPVRYPSCFVSSGGLNGVDEARAAVESPCVGTLVKINKQKSTKPILMIARANGQCEHRLTFASTWLAMPIATSQWRPIPDEADKRRGEQDRKRHYHESGWLPLHKSPEVLV